MPFIGGLCHAADFDQMCPKLCPSLEDFVTQWTLTKCGPNFASHWRTCHAVDFDQMWPKLSPLLEDFVTQRTLTKCGPKCAPCWRTLSHCGLQPNVVRTYAPHWRTLSHSGLHPNVVQTCAPQWRTSFCYGVQPHMDQQCTHHQKRPVPNKPILIVDQRGTETTISDYVAM